MAKYEPKTKATEVSVSDYVAAVENESRRANAETLLDIYADVTGMEPKMWGPTMIGYGSYDYESKSCAGTAMRAGFSPRKANLVLYMMSGYSDTEASAKMAVLRDRLGKHKTGASCLYLNKLADVDVNVLREMIELDWAWMNRKYPA
jgi:Domain of unknown function (DU1801)